MTRRVPARSQTATHGAKLALKSYRCQTDVRHIRIYEPDVTGW